MTGTVTIEKKGSETIPVHQPGYPFLFLDGILEERERKLTGYKNVTFNEAFFAGHFPGQPVMPGVLIVESLIQAAQKLIGKTASSPGKDYVLVGLERVRFKKPVLPGDRLILDVELVEWDGTNAKIKGEARVGSDIAASGSLALSLKRSDIS